MKGASRDELARRLRHVRWIGGASGAGKSTIARRLAADRGLQLYCTEPFSKYMERASPDDSPLLHAFVSMDMDERWVNRSPQRMLETFHGFKGEGSELILEDLLDLAREPPVIAEGFRLLPRLVAPCLVQRSQAVWLIPTPEFRRAAFATRGSTWDIPNRTSNPERALANLLARDQLFGEQVRIEATELQLNVIEIDVGVSIDHLADRVADALALSATPG